MKRLERLLVVMDQNSAERKSGRPAPALLRAMEFADRVGCEIQLFSTCHDASLSPSMFIAPELIDSERRSMVNRHYERLEETARNLRDQGYAVDCEVNWSYPTAEAISGKALADQSDLVIKQSDDHAYHAGIFSNTDWELIRSCPVPCLFTRESSPKGSAHGVLACIDPTQDSSDTPSDNTLDYSIYKTAQRMAGLLSIPIDVVNAFQIPASLRAQFVSYAPILPSLTGSAVPAESALLSTNHPARHGQALQAFADHFKHPVNRIIVEQGHPAQVICRTAEAQKSSMIVMGALERGPVERALLSVNAEPVLADTPCDVLFVKPDNHSVSLKDLNAPLMRRKSPAAAAKMLRPVDVEQAMTDPAAVFAEPMFVNRRPDIPADDKRRILQSWELDRIRLQESAYEGELVSETEASNRVATLSSVKKAERLLAESAV